MAVICIVAAAVLIVAAVAADALFGKKNVERTGVAMGSVITVSLRGTDDETIADSIIDRITDEEVRHISRYSKNSEIYRLNQERSLALSESTAAVVEKSLEIAKASAGMFDISIGRLSALWDFDSDSQIIPDSEAIESALFSCGFEKISQQSGAYILTDGLEIDLGAVGKGVACDIALDILENSPAVSGAVISVGGTILTYGKNDGKGAWTVGIRTPEKDDMSYFAKLRVSGTKFISTSGSYEKSFIRDGKLYHHILSPETGYPAESGLKSVTVSADNGLVADALSTACFVLGPDHSAAILEKYGADAVFVDTENNVYITQGIADGFELTDDSYAFFEYGK